MADPKGFLTTGREVTRTRPVGERVKDWNEVYVPGSLLPIISKQAGRCMDCGIPFCHNGCPLGNLIPEWNDYAYREDWTAASERLHATNNFPEFTGRLCPAPCESACVLGINQPAVTIKNVEVTIIDKAWESGDVTPQPPDRLSGKTVAAIGPGDTGADCVGTAHRQGALSVSQLEIMPRPSDDRPAHQPWPTMPMVYKVTSAHEEGGERVYAVNTVRFTGDEDGNVRELHLVEVVFEDGKFVAQEGTERIIPADLVTLAMGFTGTDQTNGM